MSSALNVGDILEDRNNDILKMMCDVTPPRLIVGSCWKRRARSGVRTVKKKKSSKMSLKSIKRQWEKRYTKRSNTRAVIKNVHNKCNLCDESSSRTTICITGSDCLRFIAHITTPDGQETDSEIVSEYLLQSKVLSAALHIPKTSNKTIALCPTDVIVLTRSKVLLIVPTDVDVFLRNILPENLKMDVLDAELWSLVGQSTAIKTIISDCDLFNKNENENENENVFSWYQHDDKIVIIYTSDYHNIWNKGSASVTSIIRIGMGVNRSVWESLYRHPSMMLIQQRDLKLLKKFESFPETWNQSPLFSSSVSMPSFLMVEAPLMKKISVRVILRGRLQFSSVIYLCDTIQDTTPTAVGVIVQMDITGKDGIGFIQREVSDQKICCYNGQTMEIFVSPHMAIYYSSQDQQSTPVYTACMRGSDGKKRAVSAAVAIVDPSTNEVLELSRNGKVRDDDSSLSFELNGRERWGSSSYVIKDSPRECAGQSCRSAAAVSPTYTYSADFMRSLRYNTTEAPSWLRRSEVYDECRIKGSALKTQLQDIDTVIRKVTGILNKFTPEKFDSLFEELLRQLTVEVRTTGATMKCVLTRIAPIIFEKAISEHSFTSVYAEMCYALYQRLDQVDVTSGEDNSEVIKTSKERFQHLLLNLCEQEFESSQAKTSQISNDPITHATLKRRRLGNIKLIAELFKRKLLPEQIVHIVIQRLLLMSSNDEPTEEDTETVCKLLESAGRRMDRPAAADFMSKYFKKLSKLAVHHSSSRASYLVMNLLDLREHNWVAKPKEQPRKLSEIDSEIPTNQSTIDASQNSIGRTVYITGVDTSVPLQELDSFMNQFGTVVRRRLCGDSSQPTQYGFFEFSTVEAAKGLRSRDKTYLGLHQIHCSMARSSIHNIDYSDARNSPCLGQLKPTKSSSSGCLKYSSSTPGLFKPPHVRKSDSVVGFKSPPTSPLESNTGDFNTSKPPLSTTKTPIILQRTTSAPCSFSVGGMKPSDLISKAKAMLAAVTETGDVAAYSTSWNSIPEKYRSDVLSKQVIQCVSQNRSVDERGSIISVLSKLSGDDAVSQAFTTIVSEILETELWLDVPSLWRNIASIILPALSQQALSCEIISSAMSPLTNSDCWDDFKNECIQHVTERSLDIDIEGLFSSATMVA